MSGRMRFAALLAVLLAVGTMASVARADGDPGSDVLVYQDLFAGSDAGLTVGQQARLGELLKSASTAGFPIRVAIIASRSDLGAVTSLWRNPRAYARFLGLELSLAYKQRLLVVMPNGFGFNWPGHSSSAAYRALTPLSGTTGQGPFAATQAAVRALAAAAGIKLAAVKTSPGGTTSVAGGTSGASAPSPGRGTDSRVATVAAVILAALAAIAGVRFARRRRGLGSPRLFARLSRVAERAAELPPHRAVPAFAVLCVVAAGTPILALVAMHTPSPSPSLRALAVNPHLDPGTPLSGPAPDFTLSDQFGQPVSLHGYRGKVVMLAFNDSECTTVCPLTTTAMLQAKAMLGRAGSRVQLLGIDANPKAISLEDVLSYSQLHGMLHSWQFLTGSLPQLKRVWKAYAVQAAVERGLTSHTPALFVIDPQGRKAKVFITQQSYAAVGQLGKVLAQEASSLLPGHPAVHSNLSYAPITGITPRTPVTLPRAGGGSLRLGPSRSPRLYLFFATWDRETSGLAGQLTALDRYATTAAAAGLPPLTAVDEGSVEPSPGALGSFLRTLPGPLAYPVAIDRTGRVADGYEVLGAPWFVLVSTTGRILYYREVSTAGWPSPSALAGDMRAALARAPRAPAGPAAAAQALAGSPPPLAALHSQASQLLGAEPALAARIRALRGYPVVVNAWASWCGPCRAEFGLFASASARFGRQVAFLGSDTDDSAGDAQSFLAQHPVSYPSYQARTSDLRSLAVIAGLPTTVFINRAGKVVFVHTGQYDSQGTLDADIARYAQKG